MPALNGEAGNGPRDRHRGDRAAQAVDDALRSPGIGVGQREQELVTADAAGRRRLAAARRGSRARPSAAPRRRRMAGGGVELSKWSMSSATTATFSPRLRAPSSASCSASWRPRWLQHPGQRILEHEPVDPCLKRPHRAAQRVERAGQHPDRVATAPAAATRRLAGGDERRTREMRSTGAHEHQPRQRPEADHQQFPAPRPASSTSRPPGASASVRSSSAKRKRSTATALPRPSTIGSSWAALPFARVAVAWARRRRRRRGPAPGQIGMPPLAAPVCARMPARCRRGRAGRASARSPGRASRPRPRRSSGRHRRPRRWRGTARKPPQAKTSTAAAATRRVCSPTPRSRSRGVRRRNAGMPSVHRRERVSP